MTHNRYHPPTGQYIFFDNEKQKYLVFCWRRKQMLVAALKRAAEFSWDSKAKKLNEIYRQAIGERSRESVARP